MTLEISQAFVDAILEQSRVEYPDECCGVILGPASSGKALRHKPMINAAPVSYTHLTLPTILLV